MPVEKILEAEQAVEPKTETYVEANLTAPANSVSQSLSESHSIIQWHSAYGEHLAHLKWAALELYLTIAPRRVQSFDECQDQRELSTFLQT